MKSLRLQTFSLFAIGFFAFACSLQTSADGEIAIIVNPSNSASTLSVGDLHRIFLGDKSTWPNGKHVFVVMGPPGSAERAAILKNVYKMSESEYAKYFLQATFTGAVSAPPKDASSTAEVKQLVAQNPGAIGYIKEQDADDSVKVLMKIP
jgi:ABC-type phosphate transport system substrate-binding protein